MPNLHATTPSIEKGWSTSSVHWRGQTLVRPARRNPEKNDETVDRRDPVLKFDNSTDLSFAPSTMSNRHEPSRISELTIEEDSNRIYGGGADSSESNLPEDSGRISHHSSGMAFLNTVKAVQRMQRREKYRKTRSQRSLMSESITSMPLDENTPLVPTSELGEDGEDGEIKDLPLPTWRIILNIFFGKGVVSWCLLAAPLAILSVYLKWPATYVFWFNFLTMIPLASVLGDFTEEAALHTNETIGGLINASFGNAVEVVVAIQALLANEIRVVQASMLGSIFSNLLLVLGCCFFFGGLYYKEQTFNSTAATANMGLLALSSIALILPTPFAEYYLTHDEHVLIVSRIAAFFLLFMYIQLLVFQLRTHAHLFDEGSTVGQSSTSSAAVEEPAMSFAMAMMGLLGTTLLVAVFSEYLVGSIDGFVESSGVSRTFVGLILLPIVGNAVEHVTAVTVAMKDKMDLAMGVAVGSCTQISLFVVPLTVLVGWSLDRDMTLNFPHFEIILYIMSVLVVSIVLGNPRCNWLEGSLLITTYVLIAVGFWFEKVKDF